MAREPHVIRVLVCDRQAQAFEEIDQAIVEENELRMVGWSSASEPLWNQIRSKKPDIVVFDMDNPAMDAAHELRQIFLESLPVGVIIILEQQDTQRVRAAMRLGVEDFQIRPVAPEALAGSIFNVFGLVATRYPEGWKDEAAAPVEEKPVGAGKLIAVTSGKAGVGKTTIGTNLALAIARETNKKVALVDLDRGDSALLLELHPDRGLIEVGDSLNQLDQQGLESYFYKHSSGVSLIIGCTEPGGRDLNLITPDSVVYLFNLLKLAFDYSVINLPTLQTDEEFQLLTTADEVLCVTTARDLLDLRATRAYLARLRNMNSNLSERVKVVANSVVVNRFIGEDELNKTLGFPVVAAIPSNEELVTTAINAGTPFVVSAPTSPLSEGVTLLARRLVGLPVGDARQGRGLFGFRKR